MEEKVNQNQPQDENSSTNETVNQQPKFDLKPLTDTFKEFGPKNLLKNEKFKETALKGLATIASIIIFLLFIQIMLGNRKDSYYPPSNIQQENDSEADTNQEEVQPENSNEIKTKVGSPTSIEPDPEGPTPTYAESNNPVQKSQIYNITQDFSEISFSVTYEDPNLLVDFSVTDPTGVNYTRGDEIKYAGKLTTTWGSNSRTITIKDSVIRQGQWTVYLNASRDVAFDIKLTGIPK